MEVQRGAENVEISTIKCSDANQSRCHRKCNYRRWLGIILAVTCFCAAFLLVGILRSSQNSSSVSFPMEQNVDVYEEALLAEYKREMKDDWVTSYAPMPFVNYEGGKRPVRQDNYENKMLNQNFSKDTSLQQHSINLDISNTEKMGSHNNSNLQYLGQKDSNDETRGAYVDTGSNDTWKESTVLDKNLQIYKNRDTEALLSFQEKNEEEIKTEARKSKQEVRRIQADIMKLYMDASVDPCEDFYQYACGNWDLYNQIPDDKAGYNTFEKLREQLNVLLRELLSEPVAVHEESKATIKTKILFKSCMNESVIEARGENPLLSLLEELGNWPVLDVEWNRTNFDWVDLLARLRLFNNEILFSEWVGPDDKKADKYTIHLDQSHLGLPSRDYFLQGMDTPQVQAYLSFMVEVAVLLGADRDRALEQMTRVLHFETEVSRIMNPAQERLNFSFSYPKMCLSELQQQVPEIDWMHYLRTALPHPVNTSQEVVVYAMDYFQKLVSLVKNTDAEVVANYILWRFIRHRTINLDRRFLQQRHNLESILYGSQKQFEWWKWCVTYVNRNMGMAVGAMFVKKYFDENSKEDTLQLTREIQQAFAEMLNDTEWIGEETRNVATDKVLSMALNIGYPRYILDPEQLDSDYEGLNFDPDTYFENVLTNLLHINRRDQGRLGKMVNKTQWSATPALVNAYYSRNKNMIMFPAGILQSPFYHKHFPKSLNFGGIGVVIGHEITHGFDDIGSLFDKHGNLKKWWNAQDLENFQARAQCIVGQYSNYTVEEIRLRINGLNTQGENIADNGGVKQAFQAYQRWLSVNGDKDERLPGLDLTPEQLFFLNFGQVWCGVLRPEAAENKIKTSVHVTGRYRVIGSLSNLQQFSEVFDCPVGSPMNPSEKCEVW